MDGLMKKLFNLLGVIISSQIVSLIIYTLLWVYLFSLIFIDTLQFFNLSEYVLWVWIPPIWMILMLQKMYDKHIFYRAVNCFKNLEIEDGAVYSFPCPVKYFDGSTAYTDGTITINHIKFKRFSYKTSIRNLLKNESSFFSEYWADAEDQRYFGSTKKYPEDLIKGMNTRDVWIGIFGIVILSNFVPGQVPNGFEIAGAAFVLGGVWVLWSLALLQLYHL
jgi:hypothetical protein